MLEQILRLSRDSSYDFRTTANPDDPLSYLFDEWVTYYRTKWAIAKVLRPKRICEISVRYGYSALAFLAACPDAEYVGIDADRDSFGGQSGALAWAQQRLSRYRATLIKADSQTFGELPGGRYDLVHVDGQQDGVGTLHDLELALRSSEFILLDGYLWTPTNCFHASDFLHRNRALVEYSFCVNGYAGDLVIRPARMDPPKASKSGEIRDAYTKEYYEQDCGGYTSFKRSGGALLEEGRLRAVAALGGVAPRVTSRALDLGCGRGELSSHLARAGYQVTAIDYSRDAIDLARSVASRTGTESRITFKCASVTDLNSHQEYDAALAADLIEHLNPQELNTLYRNVARALSPAGVFAIHTFPNAWYYRYGYSRRLKQARSIDAYLSPEPRSRYELLMHINEQSPRVLRRQLKEHFRYVRVWFANGDQPGENLRRPFTKAEMRDARDLYAVASHSPIEDNVLIDAVEMHPTAESVAAQVRLQLSASPSTVRAGERFQYTVKITNGAASMAVLKSEQPYPVLASYHWLKDLHSDSVIYDGVRSRLPQNLRPGEQVECRGDAVAPEEPGEYILRATLVQEAIRWFDGLGAYDDRKITVTP